MSGEGVVSQEGVASDREHELSHRQVDEEIVEWTPQLKHIFSGGNK